MRVWFLVTVFSVLAAADIALGPVLVTADGAGPDLLLPLAVYVALCAPWSVRPWFYWGLGTFSDLVAVPSPGLRGFTYLMVALAIERLSPGRRRRNPLLHGVLIGAGALVIEAVYFVAARHSWPGGGAAAATVVLKSALMTGLAGLLLCWPLNMASRLFGWPAPGRPLSWGQLMASAASGTGRAPRDRSGR